MPGGHLREYIGKHPDASRLELVGIPFVVFTRYLPRCQLSDIATGLCHLHSCNVIHGDLKGVCDCPKSRLTTALTHVQVNILVNASGRACLADFGLAIVTQNLNSTHSASRQRGYTARWAAPEVLSEGSEGLCSKETDIFSFAMVMVEVCRG
jgi:serine/threonine protein kinase